MISHCCPGREPNRGTGCCPASLHRAWFPHRDTLDLGSIHCHDAARLITPTRHRDGQSGPAGIGFSHAYRIHVYPGTRRRTGVLPLRRNGLRGCIGQVFAPAGHAGPPSVTLSSTTRAEYYY
eukprot:3218516-Rhodomonas_salina.2